MTVMTVMTSMTEWGHSDNRRVISPKDLATPTNRLHTAQATIHSIHGQTGGVDGDCYDDVQDDDDDNGKKEFITNILNYCIQSYFQ